MYSTMLLTFTLATLAISLVYFYMFSRNQERFMQYWGFSWVAYSFSLLFLLIHLSHGGIIYLEIRKIIDMFNILLLLFGVYSFIHTRIPAYWYRFSLYLILLSGICMVYKFDLISFYLPISVYQVVITLAICYHIMKYWLLPKVEKMIALVAFILWGVGNPLLSMYELFAASTYSVYITELILSNILNFCILAVYAQNAARSSNIKNELYENVAENAKDVIFYYRVRPFRSFQYISPSIERMTGYPRESFYSDPRKFVDLVSPEFIDEIEDVLNGDLPYDKNYIIKILTKGGDAFWGEINISVIEGDDGHPDAIECMLRDITEMKSTQLEQIRDKEERDRLLSYISHELRTPVTSIAGYLTAINDGIIKGDEVSSAMEIITNKTMTLKSLIDDLDQLSKLETKHFSFDFMLCSIDSLSEKLVREHIPDLQVAGMNHEVIGLEELPADLCVIADEDRISQVFGNLTGNAAKYSPAGTDISISFSVDNDAGQYCVNISDQGPGIDSKDMGHIFERFYRSASTTNSARDGRGLGLTLSMEIIKAHNGQLYAKNNGDRGCTFTFTIPLFKEDLDV